MESAPDYRWPSPRQRQTPLGLARRALFHSAALVGRTARSVDRQKRLLVIRTDGIGDALLFEPALRSLAKRYPDHALHLWATESICELYQDAPYIAERHVVPRGGKPGNLDYIGSSAWHLAMGYLLGRYRYDIALYPAGSAEPMGNWLFRSVHANQKWLADSDLQNQFEHQRAATRAQATHVLSSHWPVHELTRNAELSAHWSGNVDGDAPRLYSSESARHLAWQRIAHWQRQSRSAGAHFLIGVVPSASMPVKHLTDSQWVATLRLLWNRHRMMPVLLGGSSDRVHVQSLSRQLENLPHVALTENLPLPEYGALLAQFHLVIAVDTAAAHMTIAQKTPTVALVTAGHPNRFLPWPHAPHAVALTHAVSCGHCHLRCTQPESICLTRIAPGEIITAATRLLSRSPLRATA